MAARLNPRHQEMIREKIRASQLVNRLENYAFAKAKDKDFLEKVMTDGQVRTALGLLAKCVPDLRAIEHSGELTHTHVQELSDAELANIAAAGSKRIAEKTRSTKEPSPVH